MNIKAIASTTGLKPKMVRLLEKKGLITDPLTPEQAVMMESLSTLMRCTAFVKMCLAPLNPEQRARLLFGAGHTEMEQRIIHQLLHHYSDREENPYNLNLQVVVNEVMGIYKIKECDRARITEKVKNLRKKVNNMRSRYPNLVDIATRLTRTRNPKSKVATNNPKKDLQAQNNLLGY